MLRRVPRITRWTASAAIALAAGLIVFGLAAGAGSGDVPAIDDVLARTRQAVFGPTGEPEDRVIQLQGPARVFDMDMAGTVVFDEEGRFRFEMAGQVGLVVGHDGTHTWEQNPAGNVRQLQDGNATFQRLFNGFIISHWLSPEADLQLTVDAGASNRKTVAVRLVAGHGAEATAFIDRRTWLPGRLETTQMGRDMVVALEWGTTLGDRALPRHLGIVDGGKSTVQWDITGIETLAEAPSWAQPADAIRVVYDATVDPDLRVMKASGGHLWVRPLINGRDMGWFLFDTGADGSIIDESVARELDLPVVGKIDSTGLGGRSEAAVRKVGSMQLAGVRVEDIPVVSRDLRSKSRAYGAEIAGLLGCDLLAHGIIVYNERDVAIQFHVPQTYELPRSQWVEMPIHNGKPAVRLEYEGHTGLFEIDTGAPGRLIIGPHAVDRYDLLDGRTTRPSTAYGSGGSVPSRNGTLNSVVWGGRRFENVPTIFLTEDQGAGADILRDGIVGANLIRRFVVVFDIEGERTAFLDHR